MSETFVYDEARGLLARGHGLSCVALGQRADGALNEELPSWPVLRPGWGAGLVQSHRLSGPITRESFNQLSAWQRPGRAWRALGAASAPGERLHAHFAGEAAEWAWALGRSSGRPYTVTVHAADLFRPRPSLARVLGDAEAVVTVSAYNAAELSRRYGVRAQVVRCGVDPARWPQVDAAQPGPALAVGRWVPKKGLDLLISAVEALPEAQLRLCSDAPPQRCARVQVLGLTPRALVAEQLRQACLFVLPCRVAPDGDRDGLPVAMMEAMVSGLPVLTTTLEGLEELVPEGCGWRVPPDDPVALRRALREALNEPEERRRRGAAARAHVLAGFTLEQQVSGLLAVWGAA